MNNISIKKILIALVVVAIVVAAVAFGAGKFNQESNSPINQGKNESQAGFKVEKKQIDSTKLPDKFPTDIPLEAGANVVQNYNASTADGQNQATRSFVTAKSLAENLTLYTKYMKDKGWTIKATVDNASNKMVMGVKGDLQLQVSMSENTTSKEKTVTIYITQLSGN